MAPMVLSLQMVAKVTIAHYRDEPHSGVDRDALGALCRAILKLPRQECFSQSLCLHPVSRAFRE
jgi:hypothetical protein